MTIIINVPDEVKLEVEEAARRVNLSLSDFAQLAFAQALARTLKDPRLEKRAAPAKGDGWERLRKYISDAPPIKGTRQIRVILYAKEPAFRTSAFAVSDR